MVPCERKADLDEFEHGLEFIWSRVNGVSVGRALQWRRKIDNWGGGGGNIHIFVFCIITSFEIDRN